MFDCLNVGDLELDQYKEFRLASDFSVKCEGNSEYINWRNKGAIPLLVMVGIGFPLFIFGRLFVAFYKGQLEENRILYKYGFVYYVYQRKYYFWDFVSLLMKLLIILVNAIF